MSNEDRNLVAENPEQWLAEAHNYVEQAREHYREEHGEYVGNRSEYQQMIAEVTTNEAEQIVDSTMEAILAAGGMAPPKDYEDNVQFAGYTWKDFRSEFSRILAGFGVMTSRLERDGYIDKGYAELPEKERMEVASVLFSDFIRHNALRFGVDSTGLTKVQKTRFHDEEGGITEKREMVDRDKARDRDEIARNMRNRGYRTGTAAHPSGKISPKDYIRMRRAHPELDKDHFDRDASFYQNLEKHYENLE